MAFWVIAPEDRDGGSTVLQNVGFQPPHSLHGTVIQKTTNYHSK